MKKVCILTGLFLILFSQVFVFALEVPISQTIANVNGVQLLTQVFKADALVDPEIFLKEPFILDGFKYSFYSITKEEIKSKEREETVSVTYKLAAKKEQEALSEALKAIKNKINYENYTLNSEGFTGVLTIDIGTLRVLPVDEKVKTREDVLYKSYDLEHADTSSIPTSIESSGKTYKATDYTWSENAISSDNSLMNSEFSCNVKYVRNVSYAVNDGYIATVDYKGEVFGPETLLYTVVYKGEDAKKAEEEALLKIEKEQKAEKKKQQEVKKALLKEKTSETLKKTSEVLKEGAKVILYMIVLTEIIIAIAFLIVFLKRLINKKSSKS